MDPPSVYKYIASNWDTGVVFVSIFILAVVKHLSCTLHAGELQINGLKWADDVFTSKKPYQ